MDKDVEKQQLNQAYWNERWENRQMGWDIGYASTPIVEFMNGYENKDAAILIPGCGNAYEANYLLDQGFTNITLIDIAPKLVEDVRKRMEGKANIKVLLGDFFDHEGSYDLILEQTFFCAIDPTLRPAYISKTASLLKEDGLLAGVLFNIHFQRPGPPFGGHEEEYRPAFEKSFELQIMEPSSNSIPERKGSELFIKLKKKNVQN
ncbi:methyltransferase domain-containing protein [Sphingobacterium lactis]|uniref:methyltransferase domain-containing protein n=1 Tax=Sphingobacterium lactis TaxID=797291 RepID=UPI003F8196FB